MGIAQHRTRRRQIRWAELFQIHAVDKRNRLPSQFVYSAQVVIFGSNGLVTEANLKFMTASSVVGVIPLAYALVLDWGSNARRATPSADRGLA